MASFDFSLLSDSTNPDRWVEEEAAWAELCKEVDGFGHIFYRPPTTEYQTQERQYRRFLSAVGDAATAIWSSWTQTAS